MKNSFPEISKAFNPPLRNTYYFIRRGLLKKIYQYSDELSGDILDFGCGSKPYKSLFKNAITYTGLDFENIGHPHSNEQIDVFYDGKTLPFENEKFDSVFASEVFEHVFNLEEIIPELHRVMKVGGKILITCPFVWNEHEVPHDYARYTQFALENLLKKNGFEIIVIDKSGDFYMTLHQLKMVYISNELLPSIPIIGKIKFIRTNIQPLIIFTRNAWFKIVHNIMPKRYDLYLNNIVLAKKKIK
jgi:SAM-dependent methyltransferase